MYNFDTAFMLIDLAQEGDDVINSSPGSKNLGMVMFEIGKT